MLIIGAKSVSKYWLPKIIGSNDSHLLFPDLKSRVQLLLEKISLVYKSQPSTQDVMVGKEDTLRNSTRWTLFKSGLEQICVNN